MRHRYSVVGALLTLACATTPSIEQTDKRIYLASAETARSEADVRSCAESQTTHSALRSVRTENTAYGSGPVSDALSYRTSRAGDRTVLMVTARSWVFPESGRGEANSNRVSIPVTEEAKDRVSQVLSRCAGEPR